MTVGDVVWAVIGAGWVVLFAASAVVPKVPGALALLRALVGSWTGRVVALAAWGEVGWHLFCQRP